MRLFLIRHGETVDNIAGIYAGVRDSQLTIHGLEQTRKLGAYFVSQDVRITHIFSSPLIRTVKTAQAVLDAQNAARKDNVISVRKLAIVKDANLIEQDFGYYEGKAFHARQSPDKSGRQSHAEAHRTEPGFVDVESKEAMGKRADAFLDRHFFPLLHEYDSFKESRAEPIVAIVSHGMLLATLWRRMLRRISNKSLIISPEVTAARGSLILEHLGGWSNTGYLELDIQPVLDRNATAVMSEGGSLRPDGPTIPARSAAAEAADGHETTTREPTQSPHKHQRQASIERSSAETKTFAGFSVAIVAIDSKQHLHGLKRQRGGIGRLAVDESQKKLDTFFKRPRKE